MKEFTLKFGLMGLLAVCMIGTPVQSRAQATNALPPGFIKIDKDRFPFHGKIKAIDKEAKTITVKNDTIQITPETIITRRNKPITLADAAPGETVDGTYRKGADGKLKAVDLLFPPRRLTQPPAKTNQTSQATTP
jgi:Cu/Ag efflux protein CusF